MTVRQDSWSHEDDLLLAETVLRHIREGSTQLNAFAEVGDKLNRTSAACGFRWNAEIRHKYDKAMELAKKQRKERKRALAKQQTFQPKTTYISDSNSAPIQETTLEKSSNPNTELSLGAVIHFLENYRANDKNSAYLKYENDRIAKEVDELRNENKKLEKKANQLKEKFAMMQEDYQSLVQIMDRARRLVLFDDNKTQQIPNSQMENNDNYGQIAE